MNKPMTTLGAAPASIIERKQREAETEVCEIFSRIANRYPAASWHRLTVMAAAETGMSPKGLKELLERNGIINPNKRTQK